MDRDRPGAQEVQEDPCLRFGQQCQGVQASRQSRERHFHLGDRWDQWDQTGQAGRWDPHHPAYPPARVLPVWVKESMYLAATLHYNCCMVCIFMAISVHLTVMVTGA